MEAATNLSTFAVCVRCQPQAFPERVPVHLRRHELLERPLTLWNHVDIDFAEETRMCIQNRSNVSLPIVAASTSLPLVRALPVAYCDWG